MNKIIDIKTVLENLYNISGFRLSIYDTNQQEIAAYPENLSKFCTLIQACPGARECCIDNDAKAFAKVKSTEELYIYRCPFGLYEAVAPLYHFGILTGYLMMGQTIDTSSDSKKIVLERALPYIKDRNLLEHEIQNIPTSSKKMILACVSLMNICAEYISISNRLNIMDKNIAHEIKKYINKNFSTKITMNSLSSHFFFSKQTLMNLFKNTYGITISKYLLNIRLSHSLDLLKNTTDSIYLISHKCGFSDQNYFAKVFMKEYNLTPSEYRKP